MHLQLSLPTGVGEMKWFYNVSTWSGNKSLQTWTWKYISIKEGNDTLSCKDIWI